MSTSNPLVSSGGLSGGGSSLSTVRVLSLSCSFALARLRASIEPGQEGCGRRDTYLFWNQICVCLSSMPSSRAISFRRADVGLLSAAK